MRSIPRRPFLGLIVLACGALLAAPLLASCSSPGAAKQKGTVGGGDDDSGLLDDTSGGLDDVFFDPDAPKVVGDPVTCAEAAVAHTYVGCDYWPTTVANNVWAIFDFAVVVANAGRATAAITISGPSGFSTTGSVAPGSLQKFYLPWNLTLKGPDVDTCGGAKPLTGSVYSTGGAYHLTSTAPVTVYQFNALEYSNKKPDGTPTGPPGKDWSSCPGDTPCATSRKPIGCNSYTNDASLLLPSTAMTGNYRVMGPPGWSAGPTAILGSYFAITATQNGTTVKIQLGLKGDTLAGGPVSARPGGGTMLWKMEAGDVVEVVGPPGNSHDFSGTIVNADKPVQVISGIPCTDVPEGAAACDHLESTVFPAETLGKDYYVPVTTGPKGDTPGHVVRIFGNVDGTNFTYDGTPPPGAPSTISAGQVADLGVVTTSFHIKGDKPFGVGTLMLGGSLLDKAGGEGDPSQSFFASTEQFRKKYVFLAPDDYDVSWADVVAPTSASISLDGASVGGTPSPIGSGYQVLRVKLGPGTGGAHVLTSDQPVGLQVMGYGKYTSYQYPAGLNLNVIAAPPLVK